MKMVFNGNKQLQQPHRKHSFNTSSSPSISDPVVLLKKHESACSCVHITPVLSSLQGLLLYCDYQASTIDLTKLPARSFEAMDHFAKCFVILRLEAGRVEEGLNSPEEDRRGWRAVRVDLVSPPVDRYAFALLGWTGSRVRNLTQT